MSAKLAPWKALIRGPLRNRNMVTLHVPVAPKPRLHCKSCKCPRHASEFRKDSSQRKLINRSASLFAGHHGTFDAGIFCSSERGGGVLMRAERGSRARSHS
jgi:hypothetical protein